MHRSILLSVCVVLSFVTIPAVAATRTWSGAVNDLWSTAGNWTEGVAPADGDSLVFPLIVPNRTSTNDLAGLDLQAISFAGGDALPAYTLSGNAITLGGGIVSTGGVLLWSIPTTLAASQTFADGYEAEFAGPIDLNGHTLTLAAGVTRLSGSLTGTGALQLTQGHLNLSGTSTFVGPLSVAAGARINVTGTISGSTLALGSNAVLAGTGTVPAATLTGAFLRPGNAGNGPGGDATGILTAGAVTMTGGSFDAAIKGTTPGSGHDQLSVSGSVTLDNPQLLVSLPVGSPVPGHAYVIVQNDGAEPIAGVFSGLPEGASVAAGSAAFQITYTGGDGNDVALITLSAGPKSWTGAVNDLWSVGGNWSGGVPPADGDALVFPAFVPNRTNVNDLAGLDLQSLSFGGGEGFPYNVSGNPITLSGGITAEGTVTWSVPTTLAASQTFEDDYEFTFAGPIDLNGHTLTLDARLTRLSGSLTGTGAFHLGRGYFILSGAATFTGPFTLAPGAQLNVLGTISASSPLTAGANAVLAGAGTIPAVTLQAAILGPGHSGNAYSGTGPYTGILSAADVAITGGRFDAAIKGTTPGTGYDQLSVSGAVTLGSPQLLVSLHGSAPVVGNTYVLIDNDSTDPVHGAFSGRPEGASFLVGSTWFRITYAGGTGNDVVLTAVQATSTTLAASPNPAMAGQPVTLTATVSATSGTPAGTVRFVAGTTTLGTATLDTSGIATATLIIPTGEHSIVAEYEGSGLFASSSSVPVAQAVHAGPDVPALDGIGLLLLVLMMAVTGVIVARSL